MATKTFLYTVLCVLMMSMLSACGYHLRGHVDLSKRLDGLYVQADNPYAVMVVRLNTLLQRQGVQLATKKSDARLVLRIITDKLEKNTPVLDQAGKALGYELRYHFTFSVTAMNGEILLDEQRLMLDREYLFDGQNIMATRDEEQGLVSGLQDELLYLILLRLQTL